MASPAAAALTIIFTYLLLTGLLINNCRGVDENCAPPRIEGYLKAHSLCAPAVPLPIDEAARFWPSRFMWVFSTGVLLLTNMLCVAVSLYMIWNSFGGNSADRPQARHYSRGAGHAAVGVTLLLSGLLVWFLWWAAPPPVFMPQMHELLGCTAKADLPFVIELAYWTNVAGLAVTLCLVAASCAILAPPRRGRHGALELAARMDRLRVLLYSGTLALVTAVLRVNVTTQWALSYLAPESDKDKVRVVATKVIGELASAFTTTQAASNTLLLAAVYVPAFLVLRGRAARLADGRMPPPAREKWLKERGLSFSFSEYVPRIVAILGPLLAGPLGELLGRLG